MLKRFILFASMFTLFMLSFGLHITAAEAATVRIDNQVQRYDQPPQIIKNRTLVPMRGIFESLGATVSYDAKTKKITGRKGPNEIVLHVGKSTATINGTTVRLDAPPTVTKSNRTVVPLRFIGESLGASVHWTQATKTANITRRGNVEVVNQYVRNGLHVTNFNDGMQVTVREPKLYSGDSDIEQYVMQIIPADTFRLNELEFLGYSDYYDDFDFDIGFEETGYNTMESLRFKTPLSLTKGRAVNGSSFFFVDDYMTEVYMVTEDRAAMLYPAN
ncbi:copper amine oxidase N-terminal domain-containing protein [Paenalkalicoccus suaedae]|uniref:Copper amine oxidase N-terminal domain-containing protein n=1 Tax=Paenalkalicoccus suaedae TaxID=2592382 RepID=A0A859FHW9_9BACI|nr:copper amine oxidase N-terminal domain-containing protein [Paenalkalicoccus suaedae]QKS72679.1 copper amine oxidase N-terminal domain-containing protein [Paenalkalicoccus suaedae]